MFPFLEIIWSSRDYHMPLVSYRMKFCLLSLIHKAIYHEVPDYPSSCIFSWQLPNPSLQPHSSTSFVFIDSFINSYSRLFIQHTHSISCINLNNLVRWAEYYHFSSSWENVTLIPEGHGDSTKYMKIHGIFVMELTWSDFYFGNITLEALEWVGGVVDSRHRGYCNDPSQE